MKEKPPETSGFDEYRREVLSDVSLVREQIERVKDTPAIYSYEKYTERELRRAASDLVRMAVSELSTAPRKGELVADEDIELSDPPRGISADLAIPCHRLARELGLDPLALSAKIAEKAREGLSPLIASGKSSGSFANIEINRNSFYRGALSEMRELRENYGANDEYKGKTVVVDYSSPNIAKPIGVGHLRSTVIGNALSNIYEKEGAAVVRYNHLGDWGTQFGRLAYAFKHWADEKTLGENAVSNMKDLYVRFGEEAKDHPEMEDEARENFLKLEGGDPETVALWKVLRNLSSRDFEKMYKRLGISFDLSIGESFFARDSKTILGDCVEKGLARKKNGAVVVEGLEDFPLFPLSKEDGGSLYLGRDLASLAFREKTFRPDRMLYVVGNEQELNFQQLKALGEKTGYVRPEANLEHVGFGMVLGENGEKMSTRKGTSIELETLLSKSVEEAAKIITEKDPARSSSEREKLAEDIGVGAIIYNDLRRSRKHNISFDWETMLDIEKGSAAYLQYTRARILSMLSKYAEAYPGESFAAGGFTEEEMEFENPSEFSLVKSLASFPRAVKIAAETNMPHHIAVSLEEIARHFNTFYAETSLIDTEEPNLRRSRALLCDSTARVIAEGLGMLGIRSPEKM